MGFSEIFRNGVKISKSSKRKRAIHYTTALHPVIRNGQNIQFHLTFNVLPILSKCHVLITMYLGDNRKQMSY